MADVLDDVYTISTERGWRGVDNRQHSTEIAKGFAVNIENAVVTTLGLLQSRQGFSTVGDDGGSSRIVGLSGFDPEGGTQILLRVFGSTVQKWTGSGSWSSLTLPFTPTPNLITDIVVAFNRAFFLNGADNVYSLGPDGSTVTDEGNTNADPPRGTHAEWMINRLFVAGESGAGNESRVYFSDSLAPQTFDRTNNFKQVNAGDNYRITGLRKFREFELLVFKEVGIYIIDVSDASPANWVPTAVDIRFGCSAKRTIIQVGTDIWFLGNDAHIRSIQRNEQNKLTGADIPMSFEIQSWIDEINKKYLHTSCAVFIDNKAIFFVPTGVATSPTDAFVYDTLSKGWTRFTNMNILSVTVSDIENDGEKLYGGESRADSKVYKMFDADENDNATAIPVLIETRRDDLEAPMSDKIFEFVEFEFQATSGTATLSAQVNAGGYVQLGTQDLSGGGVSLPASLPMIFPNAVLNRKKFDLEQLGRGRDIQYKIEYQGDDDVMKLTSIHTAAFVENIEKE